MATPISNRYDFVLFFDVENGNPNGDPDAGNMPRIDPETGFGIVTDVCLKRKIRNYIEVLKEDAPGYRIYIKENVPLNVNDLSAGDVNSTREKLVAIQKAKTKEEAKKLGSTLKKEKPESDIIYRDYMCREFFDIRTFGAVMTTFVKAALNCGQVRGPVQLSFGRSIDPIVNQEITITRVAITTETDAEKKDTEMGRKNIVPYALYRAEGYVSANLARKTTGFAQEDLDLLWQALVNMFEHDHSAARGKMATRKLIIFRHESELGNAPAYKLFESVTARRKDENKVARKYEDYDIQLPQTLPDGVTMTTM